MIWKPGYYLNARDYYEVNFITFVSLGVDIVVSKTNQQKAMYIGIYSFLFPDFFAFVYFRLMERISER